MKVLKAPRFAAALEYKAVRAPAQLLHSKVVTRYLPEESGLRLGIESALGRLDKTAGKLFHDDALTQRGEALARRAAVLNTAVELEAKAGSRREQAAEQVEAAKREAADKRKQAAERQQAEARRVLQEKQAAQREAERIAEAQERAAVTAVERTVQAELQIQEDKIERAEARIDSSLNKRTAAPKAKLDSAAKTKAQATREKAEAERLSQLATAEREGRRAAKA